MSWMASNYLVIVWLEKNLDFKIQIQKAWYNKCESGLHASSSVE